MPLHVIYSHVENINTFTSLCVIFLIIVKLLYLFYIDTLIFSKFTIKVFHRYNCPIIYNQLKNVPYYTYILLQVNNCFSNQYINL